MEKRGMTQELPEIEEDAKESYKEDLMDKYIKKASKDLNKKERLLINKTLSTNRTNKPIIDD